MTKEPEITRPLARILGGVFQFLKADWVVSSQGPFPKHEDLIATSADAFFSPEAPPRAVIFISHRWDTIELPDPSGGKAEAIRCFLDAAARFGQPASLESATNEVLLSHGAFQAAHFVSRAKIFGEHPQAIVEKERRFDPDRPVLAQIGVWFDYACLPQDGISQKLKESMRLLGALLLESNVLILRRPGDEYETRAWCAVEVSGCQHLGVRTHPNTLVLRLDKVGKPIAPVGRLETFVKQMFDDRRKFGTARLIELMYYRSLPEEEEYGEDINTFTLKPSPHLFDGLREFLAAELRDLESLSGADESLAAMNVAYADFRHDMGEMVLKWINISGLRTTHERDLLYTGLSILQLRRSRWPSFFNFYGELVRRHLSGESLELRRFRKSGGVTLIDADALWGDLGTLFLSTGETPQVEPRTPECWWLFSDAPPGAGDPPDWAITDRERIMKKFLHGKSTTEDDPFAQ